jgi:hypothetical protein
MSTAQPQSPQSEAVQQCLRAMQETPADPALLADLTSTILTFRATSSGMMEVLDEFLASAVAREEVCVAFLVSLFFVYSLIDLKFNM